MPFEFIKQRVNDVILIKPKSFGDNRGFFMETYKNSEFIKNNIKDNFVQDNYSRSSFGVLRGLHYQVEPYSQSKLIRCIRGRIYDVAVDIRKHSSTFKQYLKVELSEENKNMLYIPKGFAHGFVVLSEFAEIFYKAGNEYCSSSERNIKWNDSILNIDWEIDFEPILSEKDKLAPDFSKINLEEVM